MVTTCSSNLKMRWAAADIKCWLNMNQIQILEILIHNYEAVKKPISYLCDAKTSLLAVTEW